MEPKKEGLNLKLCSILLKLQILSINILLNLAFILGIKNNTNDKNIIITDIIKNLNNKEEKELEEFQKILKENIELYQTKNKEELFEDVIANVKEENNNKNNTQESEDRINTSFKNKIKIKKRNYNEMIKENYKLNIEKENKNDLIYNDDEIASDPDESKVLKKKPKNKIYPKLLKEEKHYYYTDNKNYEWQFLEVNGVKNYYYFRCSSKLCRAFGKIKRDDKNKIFILSKAHSLNYYRHNYYLKNISADRLIKGELTKSEWEIENIRYNLFKWYFKNNYNSSEENCKLFFKEKLKNVFEIDSKIENEIKKSKFSINYTKGCFLTMLNKLENLIDENNNRMTYIIEYVHYNKIKKSNENLNMYIIMNKNMYNEIKNQNIYQYFGDATFRCVPPSFRTYRLYVISGFNILNKRTKILSYILIPNETEMTYLEMFKNLKNKFEFQQRFFTMDFNKASCKALKKIFPNIYIIKCFFHYVKSLFKHIKSLGLFKNNNKENVLELLYNLKVLSFIEPKYIPSLYKKIKKKYNSKDFIDFYKYFERVWKPNSITGKNKKIPDWNYYYILTSLEIDVKYLFLTNNISEHINKILNSHFNTKFPTFEKWKYSLLETEKEINNKTNLVERSDYVTNVLLYFIKKHKDLKISNELLTLDEITKLSSLMKSEASIGNIIPLSDFIVPYNSDINIEKKDEIKSEINNDENNCNMILENTDSENNNSSEEGSDKDSSDDNYANNNNDNLYNKLTKDDDLSYNIQQLLNNLKLDDKLI